MGLTVLAGVLSSYVTELIKRLRERVGKENTKNIIHLFILGLAIIFTLANSTGILTWEMIEKVITFFGVAIGNYEVIIKRIAPLLKKALSK